MTNPRWRAMAVAGHTGDLDTAAGGLDDQDPVVRELALGALERLGALTAAHLAAAFGDVDPAVRRRAALLAAAHPDVPVLALLDDPDATVVEAAAWTCGEQHTGHGRADDEVLGALTALAAHADDALVREAAVAALGAIGDDRAVDVIVAACADKPAVRRRAVLALAPFDGPAVDAALQAALQDRDWQVRQSAEDVLRA